MKTLSFKAKEKSGLSIVGLSANIQELNFSTNSGHFPKLLNVAPEKLAESSESGRLLNTSSKKFAKSSESDKLLNAAPGTNSRQKQHPSPRPLVLHIQEVQLAHNTKERSALGRLPPSEANTPAALQRTTLTQQNANVATWLLGKPGVNAAIQPLEKPAWPCQQGTAPSIALKRHNKLPAAKVHRGISLTAQQMS